MKTAVAEVRPSHGLIVSVAGFRLTTEITVLDLVDAAQESSHLDPFRTQGAEIPYWLELHGLLFRLAWAMAKPLERDDNPLTYVPTQRLSEFVEAHHFDGIRYPSAMDRGGTNIVLFPIPRNVRLGRRNS